MTTIDVASQQRKADDVRAERTRTELETTLGEEFWPLLDDVAIREVDIRPSGAVVVIGPGGRAVVDGLHIDQHRAEHIARAILAALPYPPEINDENLATTVKMTLSDLRSFARVHIASPPFVSQFQICIRKHYAEALPFRSGWIEKGYMDLAHLDVFKLAAKENWNIVFVGQMRSGKTTAKNSYGILHVETNPDMAIAEIMDVPETLSSAIDYVPLYYTKAMPASRACEEVMRMNVDCVGLNEARGPEAYDLIYNVWLSDHDGCSTTTHASDWQAAMWRLETLIAQSSHIPDRGVDRRLMAQAIDLVVTLQKRRSVDGRPEGRRVVEMVRITGATSSAGDYQAEHLVKPELEANKTPSR